MNKLKQQAEKIEETLNKPTGLHPYTYDMFETKKKQLQSDIQAFKELLDKTKKNVEMDNYKVWDEERVIVLLNWFKSKLSEVEDVIK